MFIVLSNKQKLKVYIELELDYNTFEYDVTIF